MRRVMSILGSITAVLVLYAALPAAAQFYTQHNLVSDGAIPADLVDGSLVNPWGLAASGSSPWWVSNNGTATSTLYNGNTGAKIPLTTLSCQCVVVPGAPTGVVFNGGAGFVVTSGGASGPARFIFASEDGSISGWNPGVPPPPTSSQAILGVPPDEANVYKGLALATTPSGDFLYATNFRAGTVDVFDSSFAPHPVPGGFADPRIPKGYAPFGIQNIGGLIYVTYALQDDVKKDDVPGEGHGFVDAFDTNGTLIRRVASKGTLNSPWGLAMAPSDFGKFKGDLLVGNFGNGRIHAFDLEKDHRHGEARNRGVLHSAEGPPLEIKGLWALVFGNGAAAGPKSTLFFTAGPFDESHGLFGSLVPAPRPEGDENGDDD
jgi:uncharacterized protein (TIGR03118 family)